jgi:hypothetical protein
LKVLHPKRTSENILFPKERQIKLVSFDSGRSLKHPLQQTSTCPDTLPIMTSDIVKYHPYSVPVDV